MNTSENKSNTIRRRRTILQLLSEKGEVYVSDLSKAFSVSEVTIRNDLVQLEQKNMLLRARGGAIKVDNNSDMDKQMLEKTRVNFHKKSRIGNLATRLIQNQDTIILGPGTTTIEVAKHISKEMELTIVTNSISIIQHLISKPNFNVFVLGGNFKRNMGMLTGPITEMCLKNFFVDKVIVGEDGCDTRKGIYSSDLETAQLMQLMINNARQVILVADSSKFTRKSLTLSSSIDSVDIVVTDDEVPIEDKRRLEDKGIRVMIA